MVKNKRKGSRKNIRKGRKQRREKGQREEEDPSTDRYQRKRGKSANQKIRKRRHKEILKLKKIKALDTWYSNNIYVLN